MFRPETKILFFFLEKKKGWEENYVVKYKEILLNFVYLYLNLQYPEDFDN